MLTNIVGWHTSVKVLRNSYKIVLIPCKWAENVVMLWYSLANILTKISASHSRLSTPICGEFPLAIYRFISPVMSRQSDRGFRNEIHRLSLVCRSVVRRYITRALRSWYSLLYNWPPNLDLLLNNSVLELIYFLIEVGNIYDLCFSSSGEGLLQPKTITRSNFKVSMTRKSVC